MMPILANQSIHAYFLYIFIRNIVLGVGILNHLTEHEIRQCLWIYIFLGIAYPPAGYIGQWMLYCSFFRYSNGAVPTTRLKHMVKALLLVKPHWIAMSRIDRLVSLSIRFAMLMREEMIYSCGVKPVLLLNIRIK